MGTFICVVVFIRFTLILKFYKEIILFLFLDIPIQEVRYMHKNCDKFLSNFISIKEALEKKEAANVDEDMDEIEDHQSGITTTNKGEEEEKKLLDKSLGAISLQTDDEDENENENKNKKRNKIIKKFKANRMKGSVLIFFAYSVILIFIVALGVLNIQIINYQQK